MQSDGLCTNYQTGSLESSWFGVFGGTVWPWEFRGLVRLTPGKVSVLGVVRIFLRGPG